MELNSSRRAYWVCGASINLDTRWEQEKGRRINVGGRTALRGKRGPNRRSFGLTCGYFEARRPSALLRADVARRTPFAGLGWHARHSAATTRGPVTVDYVFTPPKRMLLFAFEASSKLLSSDGVIAALVL